MSSHSINAVDKKTIENMEESDGSISQNNQNENIINESNPITFIQIKRKRKNKNNHENIKDSDEENIKDNGTEHLKKELEKANERIKQLESLIQQLINKKENISVDLHIPNEWVKPKNNQLQIENTPNNNWAHEAAEDLMQAEEEEEDITAMPMVSGTNGNMQRKPNNNPDGIFQYNNNPDITTNSSKNNKNQNKGKARPPTIKIYNMHVKNFTLKLKEILKHNLFTINIVNKNLIHLKLSTNEDHQKIRKYLESQNSQFYTYTPQEQKPNTLLVKGVSDTYDESDLKQYIEETDPKLKVNKVIKLTGCRWLVQFAQDVDIKSFIKLKYILHVGVEISKYKMEDLPQCRRCQRHGHISTNCNLNSRCVKCGEGHGPKKCTIPPKELNTEEFITTDPKTGQIIKTIGKPVKCCNCNTIGHVASYKKCPKRLEILEKMAQNRINSTKIPIENNLKNMKTSILEPGVTYAKATAKNNQNASNFPTNKQKIIETNNSLDQQIKQSMSAFDSDCKKFFGKDFYTCMQKVGEFASKYRQLKTEKEKSQAMFGLFLSMQIND